MFVAGHDLLVVTIEPSLIAPSPSGGSQSGPSGGSLQCRAARFLSREASYGGGLPRVSPLRVGIVTHNAAANRLTLPFLPRLRPVANGGFFFEKRRPPPRAGPARALAPDRPALWSLQIPDSPAAFPDRPTRAGPAPSLLSLSSPRRATAIVGLDRRTRNRAVGTEYATVTSQRLKPHPAALAVIEEKAGIGRHGLDGSMTA